MKEEKQSMTPDEQAAREAFERDYLGGSQHARRNEVGDYVSPSIQDAWCGWRAAFASNYALRPLLKSCLAEMRRRCSIHDLRTLCDVLAVPKQELDPMSRAYDAAYRTPSPVAAAQEWQPIETAPKDGTRIIGWPIYGHTGPREIYFAAFEHQPCWMVANSANSRQAPTHWQPLPAPPRETSND